MKLNVREMRSSDIPTIVSYFLDSDEDYLYHMGVDTSKLPGREEWIKLLEKEIDLPAREKSFYYLIWEIDGASSGHCNINQIQFGQEAYMHLHVWSANLRQQGLGTQLVQMCVPIFFEKFQLKELFCAPNANNAGPNKTLLKAGFQYVDQLHVIPGWINYLQHINRYVIRR